MNNCDEAHRRSRDEIGVALYVDRFAHTPERMKQMFLVLDEGFQRLGITPTRLGASRISEPLRKGTSRYKSYRSFKPRLLEWDFQDVRGFSLECLRPGRPTDFESWTGYAAVRQQSREWLGRPAVPPANREESPGLARRRKLLAERDAVWRALWAPAWEASANWEQPPIFWRACWIVFPDDANCSEQAVVDELMRFAALAMDEYGYIAWMRRGAMPFAFDMGMGFGGEGRFRSRDESWNRYTWTSFGRWTHRLLRDTYPINFLGRSYLDLPIEGTTLEKWILADPDRGTLEPFNGRVWVWKPVIEQIPYIREPLFRAGLLHWWQMFSVNDYTQLQVKEPFTPPDETPEMFRPEYYRGRDPKITN